MKKYSEKKHALWMAVAWTVSAVCVIIITLCRDSSPSQILSAVLFTFVAFLWWGNYAKRWKVEESHEEKEDS